MFALPTISTFVSVTLYIRFIGTSYNLIAAINAGINYTTIPWFYKQKQMLECPPLPSVHGAW